MQVPNMKDICGINEIKLFDTDNREVTLVKNRKP